MSVRIGYRGGTLVRGERLVKKIFPSSPSPSTAFSSMIEQ